jgi:hypothetical protein
MSKVDESEQSMREDALPERSRRQAYIQAISHNEQDVDTQCVCSELLDAFAKKIDDQRPPSLRTVRRWNRDYVSCGGSFPKHVPRIMKPGIHPMIEEFINLAIIRFSGHRHIFTGSNVWEEVWRQVENENKYRDNDHQLSIPSLSTVYRRVKRFRYTQKDRYGLRFAIYKRGVIRRAARPNELPLEPVEIDHTKLDLSALDNEKQLRSKKKRL